MKTRTILLAAAMLAAVNAKAQAPDTAKLIVHYKFSHLRDTTDRDKPYTENMVLFLGQHASAYKSYDRKLQQELMQKQIAQQVADQRGAGGPVNIKVTNRVATTNTEYYLFVEQGKFIRKERLITPYLIEEPVPAISWKISADTMTIGGMNCQKATARFKGRDYTAWFNPELPFRFGPWKLSGLPGLIVEAYDTKKEVVFKFDSMEEAAVNKQAAETITPQPGLQVRMIGMEDNSADPNIIAIPTDAVKTTEKEFKNLQEAMRKDPNAFVKSAMGGMGGGNMRMTPAGGGSGPVPDGGGMRIQVSGSGPVTNNPLELPEKK